jgi:hypothetical protein
MAGRYHIVVSAENNGYIGWQCKLFYYSCVTRTSFRPLFIVHAMDSEWHPDFCELVKAGALVRSAPTYAHTPYDWYPCRNTAGTLLHALEFCHADDFLVLCDPDMIFVRQPAFPDCLAGNYYAYLNYADKPRVRAVADRLGVRWEAVMERHQSLCWGVPYVIPAGQVRTLANAWLETTDMFVPPRLWEDVMYALGLSALRLGLPIELTHNTVEDHVPDAPLTCDMIHYCQSSPLWNKRDYFYEEELPRVWHPIIQIERETILGEIVAQLGEARQFYDSGHATAAFKWGGSLHDIRS